MTATDDFTSKSYLCALARKLRVGAAAGPLVHVSIVLPPDQARAVARLIDGGKLPVLEAELKAKRDQWGDLVDRARLNLAAARAVHDRYTAWETSLSRAILIAMAVSGGIHACLSLAGVLP